MRIKKIKCILLCLLCICVISFQHYYKTLHNTTVYQEPFLPSLQQKTLKIVNDLFWNVPDINFYKHHLKGFMRSDVIIRLDSITSDKKLHESNFVLQDNLTAFFIPTKSGALCFKGGTKMIESSLQRVILHKQDNNSKEVAVESSQIGDGCRCYQGWHGPNCGIPTIVQHSNLKTIAKLRPRKVPRRVINAININHEFDLLHTRFHELEHAVDVFIICESNFTAYGTLRPLFFQQQLLNGTFNYIRHKILYVYLDHFPAGGRSDGWIADDYLRTYLTRNGLSRIHGLKDDDVFVINDADEIPAREGILFLKNYDGWTEPVGIHMRKSLYGFYWKQFGTLNILSACTVAMLSKVYNRDGILLRRRDYYTMPGFREYENSTGRILVSWSIGSPVHYAGWHCSWCFRPEGIYHKLISAQNGDFPRWGDYSDKLKLNYIEELIRTGGWFDGSTPQYPPTDHKEHMYAPKYLLENYKKYSYLLKNPYAKEQELKKGSRQKDFV
ncbi:beta-1,4-mannosyl-glycoprotein 4-beta-N-acetylglucosaminyltransferase a [Paramisgurnus dabryanus]|uniref:beta-1,4-mannosyl-glycoprotein 4-beta-N-acetylglucosaminyltransferase a n=1 Tax=Paramisgurnus dabryanus TaxID=90735 RepID=UPI0031F3F6A5